MTTPMSGGHPLQARLLSFNHKKVVFLIALVKRYRLALAIGLVASTLAYSGAIVDICPTEWRLQKERCMGKLGCFHSGGDWSARFLNALPHWRDQIDTKFLLYEKSGLVAEVADPDFLLLLEHLCTERYLMILIHGWMSSRHDAGIQGLVEGAVSQSERNVILVEWEQGSFNMYHQAVSNTRVVAAEIVQLMKYLKSSWNLNYADVHLVGISLGAHIAGYVGNALNGSIARITALDAASPYFEDYPLSIRLDPTDAKFVDAIHTDGDDFMTNVVMAEGGLGIHHSIGHADFYPNGGHSQPFCSGIFLRTLTSMSFIRFDALKKLVACDHELSVDYFTQSLKGKKFIAFECEGYDKFINGVCKSTNFMGIQATKPAAFASYYLQTSDNYPFDGHHFLVKLTLEDSLENLAINLNGSKHTAYQLQPGTTSCVRTDNACVVSSMLFSPKQVGLIDRLHLMWLANSDMRNTVVRAVVLYENRRKIQDSFYQMMRASDFTDSTVHRWNWCGLKMLYPSKHISLLLKPDSC